MPSLSSSWIPFYSVTDSAAEEAGLQTGDIVMAVNGTDVTSMPHSEAANLARKGKDAFIVRGLIYGISCPFIETQIYFFKHQLFGKAYHPFRNDPQCGS